MTLKDRICMLHRQSSLSMAEFEIKAGLGRDCIASYMRRGGDKVSSNVLIGLCQNYNVNPEWLLLGEGAIYRNQTYVHPSIIAENTSKSAQEPKDESLYKTLYEDYKRMLAEKEERVKVLERLLEDKDQSYKELVNMMTERLNQKDEHIEESSKEYQRTIRQLADRTTRAPYPYGAGSGTGGYGVAESDSKFKS